MMQTGSDSERQAEESAALDAAQERVRNELQQATDAGAAAQRRTQALTRLRELGERISGDVAESQDVQATKAALVQVVSGFRVHRVGSTTYTDVIDLDLGLIDPGSHFLEVSVRPEMS